MSKFHWEVEIPEEGSLNREQGWALIAKASQSLSVALSRLELLYGNEGTTALSLAEKEELQAVNYRLSRTARTLEKDVLDRLADLAKPEPKSTYPSPLDRYPRETRELIDGYHSDIYRWSRKDGNSKVELAFALLEDSDFEPEDIGQIIKKHLRPGEKYSDAYDCPQCDDYMLGKVGDALCKRCRGWGYVIGNEPSIDEYDWSEKGRVTLNEGGTWTPEQETAEQARILAEDG